MQNIQHLAKEEDFVTPKRKKTRLRSKSSTPDHTRLDRQIEGKTHPKECQRQGGREYGGERFDA